MIHTSDTPNTHATCVERTWNSVRRTVARAPFDTFQIPKWLFRQSVCKVSILAIRWSVLVNDDLVLSSNFYSYMQNDVWWLVRQWLLGVHLNLLIIINIIYKWIYLKKKTTLSKNLEHSGLRASHLSRLLDDQNKMKNLNSVGGQHHPNAITHIE